MADNRRVDLDALLDETALKLKIGGEEYTLKDIPVSLTIELQKDGGSMDNATLVRKALKPAGVPEETIDNLGSRALQALAVALLDFFVPSDLIERMGASPQMKAIFQSGLTPSPTSSPNTQDTEPSTP